MSAAKRAFEEAEARGQRKLDHSDDMFEMLKDCSCFILDNCGESRFLKSLDNLIEFIRTGRGKP